LRLLTRFRQAVKVLREGLPPPQIDKDEHLYRAITQTSKDLSPLTHERMLKVASYLYDSNPIAKRLIDMTAEYVVSEGIEIRADDGQVQQLLQDFWQDPVNKLNVNLLAYVTELGLWGEQCYRAFVNPHNGKVSLGYIDIFRIKEVKLDSDNLNLVRQVVLKPKEAGGADKVLEAVNYREVPVNGSYYTGDTFFFKINSVKGASRGRSDLLTTADYIDLFAQFVFSRGERSLFGNVWMWDVLVEGADEAKLKEIAQSQPPPKPGGVRYHNEKMKWTAVAPDLKAYDASFDGRLIKNFILGSLGFPGHYFGSAEDINRATALEMNEPVVKRLSARQQVVRAMFEEVLRFVVDKARAAGVVARGDQFPKIDIFFPEISVKDMQKSGLTMLHLAQSLVIAEQQGWLTREAAAKLYCTVASLFGPNIEPAEERQDED